VRREKDKEREREREKDGSPNREIDKGNMF